MEFNWDSFVVRSSAINDVLSDSKSDQPVTERQEKLLARYVKMLDAGKALTRIQKDEMAHIERKKNKKSNKLNLSDTCITYLMTEYAWVTEGMIPIGKEQFDLVAIKKGNMVEKAGIQLLSDVDGLPYKINKQRIYNQFISGEVDAYLGDDIMSAIRIVDNKSSWDYPLYLKKIHTKVEPRHDKQVKGYMEITGARIGHVVHTLIDCPDEIIEDMLWKLTRKLNAATPESPEVLKEWPTWIRSMKFGQIPAHKRVHKILVEPFTDIEKRRLYDKVKACREWLYNFHESYKTKNL